MLHGREAESAAIEGLISAARLGEGGALLLEGEAGVGKTALLEASRQADGVQRLETIGLEAESALAFSALTEVTERLRDGISALPEPQAAAIRGALALAPPAPGDRFAVCAGFLGLLEDAAGEQPLVVVVDDAQWLDPASAECLAFAARRLEGRPIAMLIAARAEEPHPFRDRGLAELTLEGLDRGAARELLREVDAQLATNVAESLVDAAAGNPLALIELPGLLSEEERLGVAPPEEPLSPGASLQRAFERRVARLPSRTREALLVAASAFTPRLAPIVSACASLGIEAEALTPAEDQGLVAVSAERLAFRHPLLRGAVYRGAPAGERRRTHRALAEHADEEGRAWHLASATLDPDEEIAAALESVAHRAAARGAHAASTDALERAARLSEDREARTRRLLAAGLAAAVGGAFDRGVALLELADEIDDPVMRASVRGLIAMETLTGATRSIAANHRTLTEEAERVRSVDPSLSASLYADAGVVASVGGDCRLVLESAELAAARLPQDAPPVARCQVASALGLALALCGRVAEGREALDWAGDLLPDVDPLSPQGQSIAVGLTGRLCTGQEQRLREEARGLVAAAREAGALGVMPYYQLLEAEAAYRTGDWGQARSCIDEAIEGAEESSQRGPLALALAIAARAGAARGNEEAARAAVTRAQTTSAPQGYGSSIVFAQAALGFLELGLDRIEDAIQALEATEQLVELAGLESPLLIPWAPDLVEAYARAGRREEAARLASILSAQARRDEVPLAVAFAARCEGLAAEREFEKDFERALAEHERVPALFERARTLLAFGTRLHRARRRVEARERLREALGAFEQLGARPWAERAGAELKAAGAKKRPPSADPDELTAQEERVARAVARGATNREVATELFLSPKTIEFHLGRVYRKLGISSRTELAAAAAEGRLRHGVQEPAGDPGPERAGEKGR